MIPVTVAEAAKVLGVQPIGGSSVSPDGAVLTPGGPTPPRHPGANVTLTSLTADSRMVTDGSLFVALPGERVDGHDFVPAARHHGAAAVLVARPVDSGLSLVVPDPLAALGQLARDQVDRGRAGGMRVLAVTGSVGKTSTKDLLAQLLEPSAPTVAPAGNLNNELGLPLTIARIDGRTRFLVAEMGARGIGHIAYLCQIAPPQVGVVLNVGYAHVGEFGSQAAIGHCPGVGSQRCQDHVNPGGADTADRLDTKDLRRFSNGDRNHRPAPAPFPAPDRAGGRDACRSAHSSATTAASSKGSSRSPISCPSS